MASELASARQARDITPAARGVKALVGDMLGDVERVRAAPRAGAQPQQVCGKDSRTRRALQPDTIAHGPDGDVLILARWGRSREFHPLERFHWNDWRKIANYRLSPF